MDCSIAEFICMLFFYENKIVKYCLIDSIAFQTFKITIIFLLIQPLWNKHIVHHFKLIEGKMNLSQSSFLCPIWRIWNQFLSQVRVCKGRGTPNFFNLNFQFPDPFWKISRSLKWPNKDECSAPTDCHRSIMEIKNYFYEFSWYFHGSPPRRVLVRSEQNAAFVYVFILFTYFKDRILWLIFT